jgi:hypothetical protein
MSTKYKATVKGDKEMHGLQIRAIGFCRLMRIRNKKKYNEML